MARKARDGKSAYGAPLEANEVVMTVDKRLMYGAGLALAFVAAIALGMWTTRRDSPANSAEAPAPAEQQPAVAARVDEAAARATADALGLPTSVVIIDTNIEPLQEQPSFPVSTAAPGEASPADPYAEAKAKITPVDDLQRALLSDPKTVPLEIPEDRKVDASQWSHDVLAKFPDPNVADEQFSQLLAEKVTEPLAGPRLGITDLNEQFTYDYEVVPIDRPASHDFEAVNVGDADLVISRVYAACGCTATQVGGQLIDPAGWLSVPMTLKPGESVSFTVEFDPRAEGVRGSQAKYVQIFTNDPTKAIFEPTDPNSHETRMRIVVEPR